ncbi:universal stress protein [Corynebacteriaceae bacterium 7-707]
MGTARIVVGYSATSTGRDALHLGIAVARNRDAHLHLVMVAPEDDVFTAAQPFDQSYGRIRDRQLQTWLDEAATGVPDDVPCTTHLVPAQSAPEGLLEATRRLDGGLIVTGSRPGGLLRRHRLGTMASHLLHASHVPVALAPAGYEHPGPLGHVTAMFGPRRGVTDLIGEAIITARDRGIPLRLVSLVTLDVSDRAVPADESGVTSGVLEDLQTYATTRLAEDAAELVEAGRATTHIATGRDVPSAMAELTWHDDEIVLVASSRLASHGRMFLGSTATKMLRVAPVPVIVIPSGYTFRDADPGTDPATDPDPEV